MNLEMFRGVVPFVAVAEESSFRRAATRLGVSPAAISKAVAALEARIGLTLFVRSGRSVALTPEAQLLFARCKEAVAAVQGAREQLEPTRSTPTGELVVSSPFVISPLLAPALALLRSRYPKLAFRLLVTDRISKLAEESVDIAVRVGPMTTPSLITRRLRRTRCLTVCAPAYLARRGTPRTLADLAQHDCLVAMAPNGRPHPWLFRSGPLVIAPTLVVDHGPTLIDAARSGLGITQLLDFMAEEPLREGKLFQLLANDVGAGPDVHAVCAPGRRSSPRVRAAFDAFAATFGASM
jgi:DNA-binding transcriptional LysR family regulator